MNEASNKSDPQKHINESMFFRVEKKISIIF